MTLTLPLTLTTMVNLLETAWLKVSVLLVGIQFSFLFLAQNSEKNYGGWNNLHMDMFVDGIPTVASSKGLQGTVRHKQNCCCDTAITWTTS